MKITYSNTIFGSIFASLTATACCWIPWLAIAFGGATLSAGLLSGLEKISLPFFKKEKRRVVDDLYDPNQSN